MPLYCRVLVLFLAAAALVVCVPVRAHDDVESTAGICHEDSMRLSTSPFCITS